MTVSRLLDVLSAQARVIVYMPDAIIESFRRQLPPSVEIRPAAYGSRGSGKSLRYRVLNYIDGVCYFTFPHTDRLSNATAAFHRNHHKRATGGSRWGRIQARLTTALAVAASHAAPLRWALQKAYRWTVPKLLERELAALKPDLMVGCSFGMGLADAAFLVEAARLGIPSSVVVQSWDRTSNKGYPTVHPDSAIVWNEIMRQECTVNLEFDRSQVFVEGAPAMDRHFTRERLLAPAEWRRQLSIRDGHRVIFYACGGFGSHPANLENIPQMLSLAQEQPFSAPVHIVFRIYPQYYAPQNEVGSARRKLEEIEAVLAPFDRHPAISMARPKVIYDGENFMPTDEDQTFMLSCLANCDVSVSQLSTQMIEACIFDKPAVSISYGRRKTGLYDIDIGAYRPEHLVRILNTHAIYEAFDFETLRKYLAEALENPHARAAQRQALLDQITPVNRGTAAEAVATRLVELANGHRLSRTSSGQ